MDHEINWHAISAAVGTKSETHVKTSTLNYKQKLQRSHLRMICHWENHMMSDTVSALSVAPAGLADVEEEPTKEGLVGATQAKQQEEGKPEEKMDTARATIYPAVRHSHILNSVGYDSSS